jgi:hypothetical protein
MKYHVEIGKTMKTELLSVEEIKQKLQTGEVTLETSCMGDQGGWEKVKDLLADQEREQSVIRSPESAVSGPSCPKCSGRAIIGPLMTWKGFQLCVVVYFMSLFTINRLISANAAKANAPQPGDFVYNPFIPKTSHAIVPPDFTSLYVVGAVGLCIIISLFFVALVTKNKCETYEHRWKS